jgi:glycosyltransferase involved in cell wall biosynthesis
MAHGIRTLLEAARLLQGRSDIAFVIVGTGAQKEALADQARRDGLSNVTFVGAVSKLEVRAYWRLCDAAIVLLRDSPLFRHVLPSKMFEAMGMARPIVLGVQGESADLLAEAGSGITIPPENASALVDALVRLADDPELVRELGARGRDFVQMRFDRNELAMRVLEEFKKVI